MEGDARGQVGGMEMARGERERLAGESRGWRCGGCGGRRNEDILREEGGVGEGNGGGKECVVVPEELKFGFRDEMGEGEGERGDARMSTASSEASSAASNPPAPVITQPLPTSSTSSSTSASTSSPPSQPTRTIPLPSTANVPPTQLIPPPIRQVPSDGVPAWVDKAIAALVAALAFMVMKKILL